MRLIFRSLPGTGDFEAKYLTDWWFSNKDRYLSKVNSIKEKAENVLSEGYAILEELSRSENQN